jgi:hypothetical protein
MNQSIITVLSALVGGFFGAYFTRQSQHHKWLLERRSESFANFLRMLSEARSNALDIIYAKTTDETPIQRNIRLCEVYLPALNYAQIVKLYFPKLIRDEFYDNAKKYTILHTSLDLGDQRLQTMEKCLDRIQEIFENELSAYFWLMPIIHKVKGLTRRFQSDAQKAARP